MFPRPLKEGDVLVNQNVKIEISEVGKRIVATKTLKTNDIYWDAVFWCTPEYLYKEGYRLLEDTKPRSWQAIWRTTRGITRRQQGMDF